MFIRNREKAKASLKMKYSSGFSTRFIDEFVRDGEGDYVTLTTVLELLKVQDP